MKTGYFRNIARLVQNDIQTIISKKLSKLDELDQLVFLSKHFILYANSDVYRSNKVALALKRRGVDNATIDKVIIFLETLEGICGWLDTDMYNKFYDNLKKESEELVKIFR